MQREVMQRSVAFAVAPHRHRFRSNPHSIFTQLYREVGRPRTNNIHCDVSYSKLDACFKWDSIRRQGAIFPIVFLKKKKKTIEQSSLLSQSMH